MTQVRIPYPAAAPGELGPVSLKISLVDAAGAPVLGFQQEALRHVLVRRDLTADALVDLPPNAGLALPEGAPSYYAIELATPRYTTRYRIEVPDSAQVQELRALVAAAPLATGPQGPAGPMGPAGPAGAAGPMGPPGADGDMQAVLYDPRGVRADVFAAENLIGAIDGGVF
ncbi:hypothetical protein [Lamprocystis purpurea]|jgi:hypothetical protein|uniref:hypothetical protein n=1 Tax=Lamprocystis purpurea TaxID=61598 RepID=UPI0003A9CF0C|nr:hypothetical protein [Lamprocystis purpurea]